MAERPTAAQITLVRRLDTAQLSWGIPLAAAATGLVLVVLATIEPAGMAAHSEMANAAHTSTGHGGLHGHHAQMIIGLTLVMMGPLAIPLGRAVARLTLWWEALPALGAALGVFLGGWCLMAIALHAGAEALAMALSARIAVAVIGSWCVFTQLSRRRRRWLNSCQRTYPIRPAHAARDGATWGAWACMRCVRLCAAPMALMALSPALLTASIIIALVWWERFAPERFPRRWPLSVGYLGLALAMAAGVLP